MHEIVMAPVGVVRCTRKQAMDDNWSAESAEIELDAQRFSPESLLGLDAFSHVQILYVMHAVDEGDVEMRARHPRNRTDWPEVGIFAQRARRRPNRIGLSCCRILAIHGLRIRVDELDAIDGTPVLDIKPWVREFGPRGETRQPDWMTEIMKGYY
jgi:tRNA-Thr(GGU) m(6)t(6)A37 methyltransferase TsaA